MKTIHEMAAAARELADPAFVRRVREVCAPLPVDVFDLCRIRPLFDQLSQARIKELAGMFELARVPNFTYEPPAELRAGGFPFSKG